MPTMGKKNLGLKVITTLKTDDGCFVPPTVNVCSATGKMKGTIWFVDPDCTRRWIMCLSAKQIKLLSEMI